MLIAAPGADVDSTVLPLLRDTDGAFARAYRTAECAVFVVRPDGYPGFTAPDLDVDGLTAHLQATSA